jgi:hypothetical protein
VGGAVKRHNDVMKSRGGFLLVYIGLTGAILPFTSDSSAQTLTHAGKLPSLDNSSGQIPGMMLMNGTGQIDAIVDQAHRSSSCKTIQEKSGQESVPVDFLKGMGYSLVRTMCGRSVSNPVDSGLSSGQKASSVKGLMMAPAGLYSKKDVLASGHYNQGIGISDGSKNASHTYAILAALAMQESDANIVEGVDKSKAASLHTETAEEAGAFQVSADSQNLLDKGAYQELLSSYVTSIQAAGSDSSQLEKICRVSKFSGDGAKNGKKSIDPNELLQKVQQAIMGVSAVQTKLTDQQFQDINKTCPAFATEYAALVARTNLGHNGPLVRGEVKPSEGCTQMFEDLAELANSQFVCRDVGLQSGP